LEETSGESAAIRVAVVAETRLYREGLERVLADVPGVKLAGAVADVAAAVELARGAALDAVLIDLGRDGANAVRSFRLAAPEVRIIALAVDEHSAQTLDLAQAGVAGFVTRDGSLDELLGTLASVARDELRCSPRMAGALLRRMQTLARAVEPPTAAERLTAREREILELIDAGLANKEIARRLHIELATVKNHVHHILEKLGASRRGEAAARVRGVHAME
jgi:two-component system nitrate/nitrite response regulator NarL